MLPPRQLRRRLPRWAELRPLLRTKPIDLRRGRRRIADAATVDDLRILARKVTPRAVFDYTDGGAGDEVSLVRAREAFARVEFRPRVLRDVSGVDPSTSVLGKQVSLPAVFAPTGFTRMMHHEGEIAVARAAARAGLPYVLSTMGTTSLEQVAEHTPTARRWFQLYLWKDRDASVDLVQRALAADYEALVLTVDTPIAGRRLRDVRNGMTIPPALTLRTFLDGARHPRWWTNFLTREPLEFASLRSWNGTVAELANAMFDPSATLDDVAWLRSQWPRKLVVKGIQSVDDAIAVAGLGVDALVLSNHGGRQLDKAPIPLEELPGIRAAVGDSVEIYVDGGIRSGADVVAAVGLGADAVLFGRAYLYGLMAGGELGVQRVAEILHDEVVQTMQLLGVSTLKELTGDRVRLRG